MTDHIFISLYAVNQRDIGGAGFLAFPSVRDAEEYLKTWLERACALECIPETEAPEALPEHAFLCPQVEEAKDLEGFNGFHSYESLGVVSLFVQVLYDEKSARRFKGECIKEFSLDKIFSDEADEMIEMLEALEKSFREPLDYTRPLEMVDGLLKNQGLALF